MQLKQTKALGRWVRSAQKFQSKKNLHKVTVPLTHDGIEGWFFDLVCPGNALSVSFKKLLLLKNARENWNSGFGDVCKEKHVIINYDYVPGSIEVNNITGKMVEWPLKPFVSYWSMAGEWEVQAAFFETNNIKPTLQSNLKIIPT